MKVICQIDGQHCGSLVHICFLPTLIDIINTIRPSLPLRGIRMPLYFEYICSNVRLYSGPWYAAICGCNLYHGMQQCAAVIWTRVFFRFKLCGCNLDHGIFRFKYTTFATPLDDKHCHKDDKRP